MSHERYEDFKINKDSCSSVQNFCSTAQKVSQLFKLDEAFPNILQNQTLITPNIFQEIKNLLQEVHNYGATGTKNPVQTKIDAIEIPKNWKNDKELEKITIKYYNQILDTIDASDESYLKNNAILLSEDFDKLKTLIGDYQINNDRCNVCNADKNCSQYVPSSPTTPTTPTYSCFFFQFFFRGSGCGGGGGDGCPCGGQCLMSEGSSSPCTVCEGCNTYSP